MAGKEKTNLLDFRVVVSFGLSRGHLDSMRTYNDNTDAYNRRVSNHVLQELGKRMMGQIGQQLPEYIEELKSYDGLTREWKLDMIVIPYDVLVNMLEELGS